jgi:hypothetical protein
LIQADAILEPDTTNEEVAAAQQRAIELVNELSEDWSLQTREPS